MKKKNVYSDRISKYADTGDACSKCVCRGNG